MAFLEFPEHVLCYDPEGLFCIRLLNLDPVEHAEGAWVQVFDFLDIFISSGYYASYGS